MSVQSMLSDLAGMLYVSSVVGKDVSSVHKFCNEETVEGLLLGRNTMAKAFGLPVEHVHYLPRGMMGNINDMVCMYSTEQSNGVFHWSKRTINSLDNATTQDKRLSLVMSMCTLFLHLMLDLDDSLLQGSFFEDFTNDFNLPTKKVA